MSVSRSRCASTIIGASAAALFGAGIVGETRAGGRPDHEAGFEQLAKPTRSGFDEVILRMAPLRPVVGVAQRVAPRPAPPVAQASAPRPAPSAAKVVAEKPARSEAKATSPLAASQGHFDKKLEVGSKIESVAQTTPPSAKASEKPSPQTIVSGEPFTARAAPLLEVEAAKANAQAALLSGLAYKTPDQLGVPPVLEQRVAVSDLIAPLGPVEQVKVVAAGETPRVAAQDKVVAANAPSDKAQILEAKQAEPQQAPLPKAATDKASQATNGDADRAYRDVIAKGAHGPIEVRLDDQATMWLPAGRVFINAEQGRKLFDTAGEAWDGARLGLVLTTSREPGWAAFVERVDDGHVKDGSGARPGQDPRRASQICRAGERREDARRRSAAGRHRLGRPAELRRETPLELLRRRREPGLQ